MDELVKRLEEAARRADALLQELGRLVRAGKDPSPELVAALAELEDQMLRLQRRVAAAMRGSRPLN